MKRLTLIALMMALPGCAIYAPDRANVACAAQAKKIADAKTGEPNWWRVFEGDAYDACAGKKT